MASGNRAPDTITDPVDWAKHYWEQQGLDGDEQRFLALTSLLRYQRIFADTEDSELKKHGLNMTDYLLLMTLQLRDRDSPAPPPPATPCTPRRPPWPPIAWNTANFCSEAPTPPIAAPPACRSLIWAARPPTRPPRR